MAGTPHRKQTSSTHGSQAGGDHEPPGIDRLLAQFERSHNPLHSRAADAPRETPPVIAQPRQQLSGRFPQLIQAKQALGRWLTSTPIGFRLYVKLKGVGRRRRDEQSQTSLAKAEFETVAQRALENFLAQDVLRFPNADNPQVSIVLVLFNQAALTLQCLYSILRQRNIDYELVIVDNASTDETPRVLKRLHGATVVANDTNLGFTAAVNQGVAASSAANILLLNNDAILLEGSIGAALATLESSDSVGSVGGRIIHLDGRLQEAGSIVWQDGSCDGYGRGNDPNAPEFMFRRDVDFCSAAFLLTRRDLWNRLGGFDACYTPAYYEDVDYCVRLKKLGWRNVYEPWATILHYEFASSTSAERAIELQRRHRGIFVDHHADFLAGQPARTVRQSRPIPPRNGSSPRLLFIDDRVPHPSLGAGYPRCASLIEALHKMGFAITFYPLIPTSETWSEVHATLPREIEVILPGGPYDLVRFLRQRRKSYELALISRPHNLRFAGRPVRGSPIWTGNPAIVYDAEAVAAEREILSRQLAGRPLSPAAARRIIRREIALTRCADTVLTVSEGEAARFRRQCADVHVVGHRLNAEPTLTDFDQRAGLLFVGALREERSPNVDALLWLIRQIMPLQRAGGGPAPKLHVVGDIAAPILADIKDPDVSLHGRVEDILPFYRQCRIFVAPTRFSAGIPHKVHEAAAFGLPCVVTSLLAEQLGWRHECELLVADSAAEFAKACMRLDRDRDLWHRLRSNALAAVKRDCSPQAFDQCVQAAFSRYLHPSTPVRANPANAAKA